MLKGTVEDLSNCRVSESQQLKEINFSLRSPKRGKIHRGPMYQAYNKISLGSIPRKTEKILFEDSNKKKYAFWNATERFQEKNESEKYSFPGPGNYSVDTNDMSQKHIRNPSFSIKGYGNGFLSNIDRFDNLEEYFQKFSPGPGNYNDKKNTIIDGVSNSNLYKNLYNTDKIRSKKVSGFLDNNNNIIFPTEISPGPGQYEPPKSDFYLKTKDKKENFYFVSKEKRNMPFENIPSFSPGPGRYYLNSLKEFNLVKDPEKTSFFFKYKKDDELDNNKKLEENLESIIYSPIVEKLKQEKDFEKYKFICESLNIKVNKKNAPGPGEYDVKSDFGKLNYDYNYQNSRIINEKDLNRDKEKEKELEQINILKKVRKEAFMPYISPFKNMKNSANYVFKSNIPNRDFIKIVKNPGPCYYEPLDFEKKNSFNVNLENKWV